MKTESARIAHNEAAEDGLAAKLATMYGITTDAVHDIYRRMDELRENLWTAEVNENNAAVRSKRPAKRSVA